MNIEGTISKLVYIQIPLSTRVTLEIGNNMWPID